MPSDGNHKRDKRLFGSGFGCVMRPWYFQVSPRKVDAETFRLTDHGHDDRGGDTPPLPTVGQLGGVAGGGKELAVAEAQ